MKIKINEKQNGITLIALVITIIVLLILAGASIAMLTGDNGILIQASDSKIETAVGTVKEQLKLLQGEKIIQGEKITPETLLAEGKVRRTVQLRENNKYYMYYALKENSFEGMQGLGKGDLTSLQDIFLIDDDLNLKYIARNEKEYGDEIKEKILEDETKIRFSSKSFSEYISKISGVAEGEMKFKWMKNQTSLVIADPKVDSLQDLVFFHNLTSLKLGDKANGENSPNIRTMDGIENCIKLTELYILSGPDKDYNALKNLKNLKTFYKIGGKDYENIIDGLKYCENLINLDIRNQGTVNMKRISELKNLEKLSLNGNQISKIEGLEKHTNLKFLELNGNKIIKIEGLEKLSNLQTLYLNSNKIEDITPLYLNQKLILLDLRANSNIDGNRTNYKGERLEKLNKIGEIIDRGGKINLDVEKLSLFTNYQELDLNSQKLTTLKEIKGIISLKKLDLGDNNITLEDVESQEILKSMTELEDLVLVNNRLTNITSINCLKNLKKLRLLGKDNKIDLKEIEDIISNLAELTVSTDSLKTILNCDVSKITTLNLINSNLTEIPDLSKFINLSKLDLRNNPNLSNFYLISKIASLKYLGLSNNNLHGRMIDFSMLTNLTNLNLSNNTLWSEDLQNLKVLKNNTKMTINLSNNSIIDATALLELNPSTRIDLKGNVNLSQDSKDKLKAKFGNNVTF